MSNSFVHVELNTTDVDTAKKFYSELFDWKMEDVSMGRGGPPGLVASGGHYTVIKPASGTGGGILKQAVPGAPSQWLAYVSVEDVAAATKKAKSLRAKIMLDVTEVPNTGTMSVIVDPTGAALALWKPKQG
jgi:predicted enzyme related to lactoylglutathione lyase